MAYKSGLLQQSLMFQEAKSICSWKIWITIFIILFSNLIVACSNGNKTVGINVDNRINKKDITTVEQKYLLDNFATIDLESEDNIYLLENSFNESEVIFVGETHGVSVNPKLELFLLKYFHKSMDVRYCLLEQPYYFGDMLNKYLNTGDEEILYRLYNNFSGSFSLTKERIIYFRELYNYNNSLPKQNKLKFVGIDHISDYSTAIWYLTSLLPIDKNSPTNIQPMIFELNRLYVKIKDESTVETVRPDTLELILDICIKLEKDIEVNRTLYEEYLEDNYFSFQFTVKNILRSMDFSGVKDRIWDGSEGIRDKIAYENFLVLYNYLPKGKYFGQWGGLHTFQRRVENGERIAALLDLDGSPVKGKITTIMCAYKDCINLYPDKSTSKNLSSTYINLDIFEPFLLSDLTLFKLNSIDSPFSENLILLKDGERINPTGGVTSDYFQYLIVIKNHGAMTLND